eukprot:4422302-Amphidinium_carterae.1
MGIEVAFAMFEFDHHWSDSWADDVQNPVDCPQLGTDAEDDDICTSKWQTWMYSDHDHSLSWKRSQWVHRTCKRTMTIGLINIAAPYPRLSCASTCACIRLNMTCPSSHIPNGPIVFDDPPAEHAERHAPTSVAPAPGLSPRQQKQKGVASSETSAALVIGDVPAPWLRTEMFKVL